MLLIASIAFWFLVVIGGGSAVILVVGALFGADDFLEAAVITFMMAGAGALLWLVGTGGAYLKAHHVWPWL